jgi:putative transposase
MLIQKGFKYLLYPTDEQKKSLLQCGGNTRFLWNYVLKLNQEYYKETGKFKFWYELTMLLPKIKEEYPFLKISHAQSLQTVIKQFDIALRDSFKKKKGFPKFKKKNLLNDSFTSPQGWRLGKGFVYIPKIGKVRWCKSRPLKGKPKSITISQDGNKWYCSVLCEYEIKEKEKKTDNIVGCDVGINNFIVLSDGTVINNPKFIKKYEEKLIKEQRKLSKKKKESKNRFKQRLKVRSIYNKIRDARLDFLHKISNSIAKNYDGIVVEDLHIKGMLKNHNLAKSISDASWNELNRQLEYKCKWNSKYYIKVDRFFPSTKTCSRCGCVQKMPLSKRIFKCSNCGFIIDRDLNSSINLKIMGLNTLGHSGINACGDGSLELSSKQEKEHLENQMDARDGMSREC